MALSNEYLAAMAKDDPERADRLRDGTYRMPNLEYGNRPSVKTQALSLVEIELLETWIFGPPRDTKT